MATPMLPGRVYYARFDGRLCKAVFVASTEEGYVLAVPGASPAEGGLPGDRKVPLVGGGDPKATAETPNRGTGWIRLIVLRGLQGMRRSKWRSTEEAWATWGGDLVSRLDKCEAATKESGVLPRSVQDFPILSEAEVDGVDGIFLGPFDLSASLGKMGQFEEGGEVSELIERQT